LFDHISPLTAGLIFVLRFWLLVKFKSGNLDAYLITELYVELHFQFRLEKFMNYKLQTTICSCFYWCFYRHL